MELTLLVAQVFQSLAGVTVNKPKQETVVATVADKVTSRLVEKARTLNPALSTPKPLPRNVREKEKERERGEKETGTRPKILCAPPHSVTPTPPAQDESACVTGNAKD